MVKNMTGRCLNELWQVGAKHALYREDGKWYHQLKGFPGVLFDANGYIIFETEDEYLECEFLQIKKDLHVPKGIATILGYVRITENEQLQSLIRQINVISEKRYQYSVKKKSAGAKKKPQEPKTLYANDLSKPTRPDRIISQTYRILRDTQLARWIKYIHEYKCQICDTSIQLQGDDLYAEAHHIKPLGKPHNGLDVLENIICVCPNHHAQLDYGAIKLNKAELNQVSGHMISDEYIDYHNRVIFDESLF